MQRTFQKDGSRTNPTCYHERPVSPSTAVSSSTEPCGTLRLPLQEWEEGVAASITKTAKTTQTDGLIPLCNEASSETSASNMRSSSSRSHDSRLFRRSCKAQRIWNKKCLQVATEASASGSHIPTLQTLRITLFFPSYVFCLGR